MIMHDDVVHGSTTHTGTLRRRIDTGEVEVGGIAKKREPSNYCNRRRVVTKRSLRRCCVTAAVSILLSSSSSSTGIGRIFFADGFTGGGCGSAILPCVNKDALPRMIMTANRRGIGATGPGGPCLHPHRSVTRRISYDRAGGHPHPRELCRLRSTSGVDDGEKGDFLFPDGASQNFVGRTGGEVDGEKTDETSTSSSTVKNVTCTSSSAAGVVNGAAGADGEKILGPEERRREFEMNLGRAVDTLRKDYPKILRECPDFSIFDENLEIVDPSGVKLHGISNYKKSFQFVHAIVNFFYCPESSITFRLVYDWARNCIRVSWHVALIPKNIYGGYKRRLLVDGISVYEVDRSSGLIDRHRFEHMSINDVPVRPPKGIFHALTVVEPHGVPVGPILGISAAGGGGGGMDDSLFVAEFRPPSSGGATSSIFSSRSPSPPDSQSSSSLRSASASETVGSSEGGATSQGGGGGADAPDPTEESNVAFDRKNASRKKFGLPPLSREEFDDIEAQVRAQERRQRSKQAAYQSAAEISSRPGPPRKKGSILDKIFADVIPESCESNDDCERPMVCCDFIFKQVCCASGVGVYNHVPGQLRPATVPVPQGIEDPPRNF